MTVLFIGALPGPVTGQSLACQVLLSALRRRHTVEVVNLSKTGFKHGVDSLNRIIAVTQIVLTVWRKRSAAHVIYLTVSESFAGNMKDLLIYMVCFSRLRHMVIHLHGGEGLRGIMLGQRGLLRMANEFFVRRLGGAVVLGPRHLDIFAHVLPSDKIHIVPNFAQDEMFIEPRLIDAKFAAPATLKVLFLSNLIPGKGYSELLDAFLSLAPEHQAALHIDFAGGFEDGRQRAAFLARIQAHDHVAYHGIVVGASKRRLFQQAHIFCLPTYYPYEGQPISILEAYAAGCAVITTDHSGIGDVFRHEENGILVAKRSVSDIMSALLRALGDPGRLLAMARANRTLAQREYRTRFYNERLLRIVDNIASATLPTPTPFLSPERPER